MKKKFLIITAILLAIGISVKAADLVIESKTQSYSEKDSKIKFQGDVKVSIDDVHVIGDTADVTVDKNNKLDTATFYDKPYAFEVKEHKKREVKANILRLSLITKIIRAEGETQTTVFDGKEPTVIINADTQEYDTKTNVMKADGGVVIKYKDLDTYSQHAIIRTDKKGQLQRIDLIGNAKMKQGKNHAQADHFIYNTKTEELTSIGNTTSVAFMEDGTKLVLKAKYQQYTQKNNTFLGSGDVKIWFDNYYAEGPKVTAYPDNKTKKPNEIYFSGRSSITEETKTIYADKIKMRLKPKDFFAEGNVKSVIRDITESKDDGESPLGL